MRFIMTLWGLFCTFFLPLFWVTRCQRYRVDEACLPWQEG